MKLDLPRPGDLARWLFWVKLRAVVPVDRPRLLRPAWGLWRAQHAAAGANRALMADELNRCFGAGDDRAVAAAYREAFRAHFQELLIGGLTGDQWRLHLRFQGQHHLDEALARGRGAVLLYPHAGDVMMMLAALGLAGYRYVQYAARGMAPPEVAAAHPEVFGHNRWRTEARAAREAAEDRLPVRFLTLETSPRELVRSLNRNEIVGIAYDGRLGARFSLVDYLGRRALLSPGPFKLALSAGAPIVPAFNHAPDAGPEVCSFGPAILPEGGAQDLMRHFLAAAAEPWLRANPHAYGIWLLHCRLRASVDDHPLFVDYAPDERWRRWERESDRSR